MATPKKSAAKKQTGKKPSASAKKAAPRRKTAASAAAKGQTATKPGAKAPAKSAAKKAPAKKTVKKQAAAKTTSAGSTKQAPDKKAPAKKAARKTAAKKAAAPRRTRRLTGDTAPVAAALEVRQDEAPWTATELNGVRDELQGDIDRLTEELSGFETEIFGLMSEGGDGAGDDQADVGTKTFEREHEFFLAQNSRDLLLQSQHALERIADGSYGVCENCGNPIGKMRLQAFPRATLCMSCKQKQERH